MKSCVTISNITNEVHYKNCLPACCSDDVSDGGMTGISV